MVTTLRWFDILIITFIMFSSAIYNSSVQFFAHLAKWLA